MDHKQTPVSIAVNARDFVSGLHHGHRLFSVDLRQQGNPLVKDVQYDYLGKEVIHADLIRVDLSERVTVQVPLDFRGVAKGTTMGGILEETLTQIEIECGVTEIPELIGVIIRDLGLNEGLYAKDIVLPAGMVLKTDPDALVAICHESKAAASVEGEGEEGAEAAATEPEVITERKKDEESD